MLPTSILKWSQAVLLSLLLVSSAQAKTTVCEEESKWLLPISSEKRDLVLLKISADTADKFFEVISAPDAKPKDELWGYKILSIGHYILSQSPYASPRAKSVLLNVADASSHIIRGEIDFNSFKSQLIRLGETITTMMRNAENDDGRFMRMHKSEAQQLSSCILVTAMNSAL